MRSRFTYVKNCPECEGNTQVINSREQEDGSIHRRRVCLECGFRFTTTEVESCMMEVVYPTEEIKALKEEIERLKNIINVAKGVLVV